ncbi:cytochrome c biogenesis heme-transporting ATPase CcmA [Aquabacterium sp. A7-Y]|uniref:cytochrome c biogenesis heme-transporting ATPase CcmA n=1 Tax=Aquabacterium sp. A7-Y TaxID=1349605 RepID=UPI00223CE7E4|nr:cytochrome c biogenesis heme-transporting ATPase CcmA [Aquabacterium sp. A7-Y]MCW7537906.1 cytochrome c biogenesis heme-transporting ATPase CcmA [Aquabacterium sp. A7-Y]
MLSVDGLTLVRGDRCLSPPLSFELRGGAALLVEGGNGSGKTTLLRTLCGLRPAVAGRVLWRGRALPSASESLREELAFLGHRDALHEDLGPADNLRCALALGGETQAPRAIDAALEAAGLQEQRAVPVRCLSQGQRRRAALARFGLTRKRLWILDEPLAALDAAARAGFKALLERHLFAGGLAVLSCHTDAWLHTDSMQRLSLPGPR